MRAKSLRSSPPVYSGCNSGCGGWGYERLPDPVQQYYYADQGPTYTGPGDFAPYPAYQESAVYGWGAYRHRPYYYGYDGGRYADAITHEYDGADTIDGPVVYGCRTLSISGPGATTPCIAITKAKDIITAMRRGTAMRAALQPAAAGSFSNM